MSVSPNYDVAENVSPFVQLPILVRCASCGDPQNPLALYTVVVCDKPIRDLCETCAANPTPTVSFESEETA